MLERRLEGRTLQLQFAARPESSFWPRTTICDSRCMLRIVAQLRGLVREVEQMQVVDNIGAALSALSGRSMKSWSLLTSWACSLFSLNDSGRTIE
jgi:hypothetical protein